MDVTTSRKSLLYLWIPLALVLGGSLGYLFNARFCHVTIGKRVGGELEIYLSLRKLFAEHVIWTDRYIASSLSDVAESQAVAKHLFENQDALGALFGSIYGHAAGKTIADIFKEHSLIIVDLLAALRLSNQDQIKQQQEKWDTNTEMLARTLSDLTPSLAYETLKNQLAELAILMLQIMQSRIAKSWDTETQSFDQAFSLTLNVATEVARAIIDQYPGKF